MYLIDGYNVLKQVTRYTGLKIKNGKTGFIRFLNNNFPKKKIILVFDGAPEETYNSYNIYFLIKVRFSWDESADDLIRTIVSKEKNAGNLILVTDDRDLSSSVKPYKIKICPVADFLKRCYNKQVSEKKDNDFSKPHILSLKGKKITDYLYCELTKRRKKNGS